MTTPSDPQPQGGAPSGGPLAGGASGAPSAPAAPAPQGGAARASDHGDGTGRRAVAQEFIAANRGAVRAVDKLMRENYRLRQTRKEVPDGAVVLSGDDAARWNAFRALNLAPDDVTKAIAERDTHKAWREQREKDDAIAAMAADVKYVPRVLTDLVKLRGVTLEPREIEVEERDAKGVVTKVKRAVPHVVTGQGTAQKAEPLTTYAAREWEDYLPALQGGASGGSGGSGNGASGAAPQGGAAGGSAPGITRYPAQRASGSAAPAVSPAVEHLTRTRVLPSKLRAAAKS